jgi:hypothetical protein
MTSIKLIGLDGKEFEARFAPFTASRMDKLQTECAKFTDIVSRCEQIFDIAELAPEMLQKDEKLQGVLPVLNDYVNGKVEKQVAYDKLYKLIKLAFSFEEKRKNSIILRTFVQTMILETVLSEEQLEWVKSDIESDFWGGQDAILMRDTGEFFRQKVLEYSA